MMYGYIKGTIKVITSNHVIIENNNIGYIIFTSNPYSYELEKDYKIYLYNYLREDENTLYGFKSMEEKDLFLKLINVKGLGPKTAMPMFGIGSVAGIIDAIERENLLYLTKFPKIGDKLARQIILDLKGK
ncbi:MAG: Holliday junction ATP-dependent DNA helicase RuvA, partial [Bacilli bacterium]|nr:Holliday junction ATP-dependent DNA helicase RuvA [Bacilli bacterium]